MIQTALGEHAAPTIRCTSERALMIYFFCDCGKLMEASEETAGQSVPCPACGASVFAPRMLGESIPGERRFDAPPSSSVTAELPTVPSDRGVHSELPIEDDRERSTKAFLGFIVSLVTIPVSVVWVWPSLLLWLIGLTLSILGFAEIKRSQGRLKGKGHAITGIVLCGLPLIALPTLAFLVIPPIREAAERLQSVKSLKMIGLAIHSYHDSHKQLPPHAIYSADRRPLLSWRVMILPYLEHDNLHRRFRFDEPWDGPTNIQLLPMMPEIYASPGKDDVPPGHTFLQVFTGPGTPFEAGLKLNLADIKDGTSNTILVIQADRAVPWTKPEDIPFDPQGPLPKVGGVFPRGVCFGLADGSVRYLERSQLNETKLRALITRDGGEKVSID